MPAALQAMNDMRILSFIIFVIGLSLQDIAIGKEVLMSRKSVVVVISCAALVAGGYLLNLNSRHKRGRRSDTSGGMRCSMMERMMRAMPADSPPKVISSVMPRLQEQNEEILALLREQNELLRTTQRRQ